MKFLQLKIYLPLLVVSTLLLPQLAWAAENTCKTNGKVLSVVPEVCQKTPDPNKPNECGVVQMVCTGINISRLILGFSGSIAFLMFVYGGFLWLISGGSAEQVKKGKDTFLNAVKGLALIFGAWIIINVIVAALSGQQLNSNILLFRNSEDPSVKPVEPLTIPETDN